ncbi:MAG: THUMP domain-containing protein [Candidatus Bathyarchaeota archaeon]|nr:THUMP domain-containing protein [Candidatus Bathyarchaeota archaeon]
MAKLFFLLSGEHETLPVSELKATLEAEGYAFKTLEKLDQLLRLEADLNCVEAVKRRAAFTRLCGLELFSCKAETNKIAKTTSSTSLKEVLGDKESFVVRVKRVKNHTSKIDGMTLERKLGKLILNKTTKTKVNLKNPDKTFTGILTDEKFIFGVKLAEIPPKTFVERRPKKKPFFHPSAMQAKLARCMVNLAKPKTEELLLDPFCGTGSMLIEAALIGCRVLGLDIQRRMVKGTLQNLAYFNIKPEGMIVADARNLPITKVDCVVTDPPYGRSATTLKRTTKQIIEEVLISVHDMLEKGQRVCMAAPKTLNIGRTGTALDYKHLESHFVYVHRSLTREIAVFVKK